MTTTWRIALISTSILASISACSGRPPGSMEGPGHLRSEATLQDLRNATRSYVVLDSAVAAGYAGDVKDCLVHEHHGAMGYHHVNPQYMDRSLEIDKPEILLYERVPTGEYRLNGVEFIVPYADWPRDSVAPQIMGQSLQHEDNLKFWYVHVWAWTENPDGPFANFHPGVQCSDASRKVFRPSGT